MTTFELQDFNKRIGLNTDLENISKEICKYYNLGTFIGNKLITVGYEDYNYILTTSKNKYCVKIFSKARTKEEINNYLVRLQAVANSNIHSPKILKVNDSISYSLDYMNNHYDICVFAYIDGQSYFDLSIKPNAKQISDIAKQTALINNIDVKPNFIYDAWAIINFKKEYKEKREYLNSEYQKEFDLLLKEFDTIDFNKLPKAFVHGDIISGNVMLDKNDNIWVIDFAVANYLPRIIDLAVISCNLCLDIASIQNTENSIKLLMEEYSKINPLTHYEYEVFKLFYNLANAMHILETEYIIQTDGNTKENEYWHNEGICGYSYSKDENFLKEVLNDKI